MTTEALENEMMPGNHIDPRFGPEDFPVPPRSVRDSLNLPTRFAYASADVAYAKYWNRALHKVVADYVNNYNPDGHFYGKGCLLLGESGAGKSHAAATIANELKRAVFPRQAFTVCWFSASWTLSELLDCRRMGEKERFRELRKAAMRSHLVIVDDLLHGATNPEAKEFLFAVYDFRDQNRLPIVTTGNADVHAEDWSSIEREFNVPFARRLRSNCAGNTFVDEKAG